MIKYKFLFAAVLLTVFFASCDGVFDISRNLQKELGPLSENQFYAINMHTNKPYMLDAEKLAIGERCVVWAELGSGVTVNTAKTIAEKVDREIIPKIIDAFCIINSPVSDKTYSYTDILDYSNKLANGDDGDGKLTILLLDIIDGLDGDVYIGGYFFGGDFYTQGKLPGSDYYSNGRDIIYIDTNPGLKETHIEGTYATLIHELQHMVNYATSVLTGRASGNRVALMDTWVDEGLSAWAEYLYYGKDPPGKAEWFANDPTGAIAKGNNFFVWNNHRENPDSIFDEYVTVYLFFRWLHLQADRNLQQDIFIRIIGSPFFDYRAVTGLAKEINSGWEIWGNLLRSWLTANCYPANPNYGYKGDERLINLIKVKTIADTAISLWPGEGVYSRINNSFNPSGGEGQNIRYAGLTQTTTDLIEPYTGDILLTFNSNANRGGLRETGRLTGISSAVLRTVSDGTPAVEIKSLRALDARDVIGRNLNGVWQNAVD